MWKVLFTFLIVIAINVDSVAQVKSKSFSFILNTLLSDKVPRASVKEISSNPDKYIFLDSREDVEYNVSHLPNAKFVGYEKFDAAQLHHLAKSQPIIVYCSVGKRSENITLKLMKLGFTNVQNLYGGIFEWVNQGNSVVDNNNKPTKKVHAYNRFFGKWLDKGEKVY
jgi:rhodanese-related sulfurtransferase